MSLANSELCRPFGWTRNYDMTNKNSSQLELESRILPLYSITGSNDMHKTTTVISVTIPNELLQQIDEKRDLIPRSRFVVRALEKDLK